jgi:Ulp1 family protease
VTVTRGDLNTLADEELLNDTVMDFYIKVLEADLPAAQREECHFFSTFFWKRLSQEQNPESRHAGVAKWTRKVDIFSKRFLFVPICDSLHWTLAILCRPAGIAELDDHEESDIETVGERWGRDRKDLHITLYLDSLGGYKKEAIERLGDYLRMEWRIKKGSPRALGGGVRPGAGGDGGAKGKGKEGV